MNIFVYATPSQWDEQTGLEWQRSKVIPGCQQKKASPGPSPCPQIANSPPWSDIPWEWGSLCAKVSPQPWHESKSSSPASTCQNTQGKTLAVLKWSKEEAAQENKHQLEWRSGVRKKEKKNSGLQTPQILFEEMGWIGAVGGRSKIRDGNFPS